MYIRLVDATLMGRVTSTGEDASLLGFVTVDRIPLVGEYIVAEVLVRRGKHMDKPVLIRKRMTVIDIYHEQDKDNLCAPLKTTISVDWVHR